MYTLIHKGKALSAHATIEEARAALFAHNDRQPRRRRRDSSAFIQYSARTSGDQGQEKRP
jgi:hypothetical protein